MSLGINLKSVPWHSCYLSPLSLSPSLKPLWTLGCTFNTRHSCFRIVVFLIPLLPPKYTHCPFLYFLQVSAHIQFTLSGRPSLETLPWRTHTYSRVHPSHSVSPYSGLFFFLALSTALFIICLPVLECKLCDDRDCCVPCCTPPSSLS